MSQRSAPPIPAKPRRLSGTAVKKVDVQGAVMQPQTQPTVDPNFAVLVLGSTGAGKSSFIEAATGKKVGIGHGVQSYTSDPHGFLYTAIDGVKITFIDTPGFNDFRRPDTELLKAIIQFILQNQYRIIAVLYLQRINEIRLTGSALLNLRMLRALCGESFYPNVVLVSSMWAKVLDKDMDQAIHREVEFCTSPLVWEPMRRKQAEYVRWDEDGHRIKDAKTAVAVAELCRTLPTAPILNIFMEMQRDADLDQTSAGRILLEEIHRRQDKERRALERQQEEMQELQMRTANLQAHEAQAREHLLMEQQRAAGYGITPGWAATAANAAYYVEPPPAYTARAPVTREPAPRSLHRRRSEGSDDNGSRRGWREERRYSMRDEQDWEEGRYLDQDVRGARSRRRRPSRSAHRLTLAWLRPRR